MDWGSRAAALLGIKPVAWLSGEDLARKEQLLAAVAGASIIDAPKVGSLPEDAGDLSTCLCAAV
jgi:hypothetical protein